MTSGARTRLEPNSTSMHRHLDASKCDRPPHHHYHQNGITTESLREDDSQWAQTTPMYCSFFLLFLLTYMYSSIYHSHERRTTPRRQCRVTIEGKDDRQ